MTNSATGLRESNNISRQINSSGDPNSTALEPFYGVDGQLVPGFPATFGEARALVGKLLHFWEGRPNLNGPIQTQLLIPSFWLWD